jgi:hypothetical protein
VVLLNDERVRNVDQFCPNDRDDDEVAPHTASIDLR